MAGLDSCFSQAGYFPYYLQNKQSTVFKLLLGENNSEHSLAAILWRFLPKVGFTPLQYILFFI